MIASRFFSAAAIAALVASSAPAFADDASSSSSSSSSAGIREERCARFSKGNDYERCVRLIRRLPPARSSASSSASSESSGSGLEWQWENILGRMEKKVEMMVKFASTMGRKFCRDNAEGTSQECMQRLKIEMHARVSRLIDEAFRADLPSGR